MEFDHAALLSSIDFEELGRGLNAQLAEQPFEKSAAAVLKGILQIKDAEGKERTFEQIKSETAAFFASPEVVADMNLFNQLSARFAMECQFHFHGQELANSLELSGIHNHGAEHMSTTTTSFSHLADKDEKEKSKDGKKKTNSYFWQRQNAQKTGGLVFKFGKAKVSS